jgi:CheY-like chemotaxis protein
MSDALAPRTIILVEDNCSTRRVVRNLLNEYDTPLELLEAESGEALLELCRSHGPNTADLIILDLNLISPHKHGLSGLGAIDGG